MTPLPSTTRTFGICDSRTFYLVFLTSLILRAPLLSGVLPPAGQNVIQSQPLAFSKSHGATSLFEKMPAEVTGIDFVYQWNQNPRYERLLNSSAVGGGVCAGDYDGDGLPDLCLTRPAGGYRLYRNLGNFRFTDVTDQAGVRDDSVWSTGVSFADLNNDGHLDLYICCYEGPNRLYINQGNGTFIERAKAFGLDFNGASMMMAFGDYDRDGYLDGYLLTAGLIPKPHQRFRVNFVNGRPMVPEDLQEYWQLIYQPGERAALAEAGQFDHLYHNNGDGTFSEVSQSAGIAGCDFGNAALWWDFNQDGWPDLYIANDYFGPDHLYRNNGDGTFTDVSKTTLPHTPWTSMGADIGDINRDGLIDLIASDMAGTTHYKRMVDMGDMEKSGWFLDLPEPRQYMRNAVFLNTGMDRFFEAAHLAGLASTDWTWAILLGDLDNDGWEDVFVPNGMTRNWMDNDRAMQAQNLPPAEFARFWKAQPVRADRNLAYKNLGDLRFQNMSLAWGLDHPGPSFGAVLADLDNDGDLDLVANDFEAPARLYRNGSSNHRIKVRLKGSRGNLWGIGATLRIETDTGSQMRYLTLSHGFMSASEPLACFGLGPSNRINQLKIEWPSGTRQVFNHLEMDQFYAVHEPAASEREKTPTVEFRTLLVPVKSFPAIRHAEDPYDDFQRQPLLPFKLSQLGPGLAWGDVDGDGHEDCYLGGSSTNPGTLLKRTGQGSFRPVLPDQSGIIRRETVPLFFEANGDGHVDFYGAAGGIRGEPGDESLRHQLYLNDGQGDFMTAPRDALPDIRESCGAVVAADFDRDGDLDLFVGARAIPGQYPLVPRSYLLRNEAGKFTDATAQLAPGLEKAGMVTSALWSDADNDGWLDLLVACEWGPIRLYRNQRGRLADQTQQAGLELRLGWWQGIAAGDLNHDGHMDYVVANYGLNSRYQPSPEQPSHIYYGVFEGNGEAQIIEAIRASAGLLPVRGKSALQRVFPSLSARFPTHHSYASATLPQIFDPKSLEAAYQRMVNTCESGVLLNNGRGQFAFQPLPRLAQIAPVFGLALAEIDGDGHLDLVLAQNFYGPQRETGRMDGGASLLLTGQGNGAFEPVWPNRSGLLVPGDAKSLATADLNEDGWMDFVFGVNNGEFRAFQNQGSRDCRNVTVRLQGKAGNSIAVGARVTVLLSNGLRQTAEVYAGSGYRSQSASALTFGLGSTNQIVRLDIRWPDASTSTHETGLRGSVLRFKQE